MNKAYRLVLACPKGNHHINVQRKCSMPSLSEIEAMAIFGDEDVCCESPKCGWHGKASKTKILRILPFDWIFSSRELTTNSAFSSRLMNGAVRSTVADWASKRRSQRLVLAVAVIAYRPSKQGPTFCEGTHTLVVSAHGALMNLAAKAATGQSLILKHTHSGQEQACRIVFRKVKQVGPTEVGIEFQQPAPDFWRVAFPPPDWNLTR